MPEVENGPRPDIPEPCGAEQLGPPLDSQIAAARSVLALTRSRRRGHSALGSKLLQLLVGAGSLVGRTEGTVTLNEMGSTVADAEPIMAANARSLDGVATALVAMSEAIDHPNATLDWGPIDALETQMADLDDTMGSIRRVESYDALATLRPMVEGQRHLATTTTMLASEWRDGTNPPSKDESPRLDPKDGLRARDRVREASRTLVSNLTLQWAVMRHAIRYGATSTVGVTLVMSLHLVKGYWVLITIAVVLRPYAATTLQRTVLRCGGTMLGAVIAASILVATERSASLIVIMFVLAMLTFSLMSLNYGLGVVFLTPMVIVLISTGRWSGRTAAMSSAWICSRRHMSSSSPARSARIETRSGSRLACRRRSHPSLWATVEKTSRDGKLTMRRRWPANARTIGEASLSTPRSIPGTLRRPAHGR